MFMFVQILIVFCTMASIFLGENAHAQHMGSTPKNGAMGYIEHKNSEVPAPPEGSDLPGIETKSPDEINIPEPEFTDLRLDRDDRILDIIDPLTLRADHSGIIHLTGLDIPDYNPYQQGAIAQSAVAILRDMVLDKTVQLYQTRDRETGRKNRMNQSLYHLVIKDSDSWVQGIMVRLGLARVRTDPSNPEMARALYALEAEARAQKLGLWAFDQYKVLTPEQTPDHLNSFAIVEGTVMSAARKQSNIYLNFGADWRDDFTIQIKPVHSRTFNARGVNPLDLNGKTIRVRGWLQSYNGPYIEIDHPERIEIISP